MRWVICASGPSIAREDLSLLRDCRIMAVNNAHRLVPNADVLYAGDGAWWDEYHDETSAFAGERWTADHAAAIRYRLRWVLRKSGRGLCATRRVIYAGGNSGYAAINLAYHMGAREIVLLGYDMHRSGGAHFFGEHPSHMLSAPEQHIPMWREAFTALAADLRHHGVRVVNCTQGTALTCFQTAALHEVMR